MAYRTRSTVPAMLFMAFFGIALFLAPNHAQAQSSASGEGAPQVEDPNAGLIDLIFRTIGIATGTEGPVPADPGTAATSSNSSDVAPVAANDASCGDGKDDDDCEDENDDDEEEDDDDDDDKEEDDD